MPSQSGHFLPSVYRDATSIWPFSSICLQRCQANLATFFQLFTKMLSQSGHFLPTVYKDAKSIWPLSSICLQRCYVNLATFFHLFTEMLSQSGHFLPSVSTDVRTHVCYSYSCLRTLSRTLHICMAFPRCGISCEWSGWPYDWTFYHKWCNWTLP